PAMRPRHRARVDRAVEARAEDEVVALLERVDESRERVERVGPVRVAHDDVLAARVREAGEVRAAVAAARLLDDGRSVGGRDLRGLVARPVVDDDHLSVAARRLDPPPRLVDDRADRLLLVEAGDDDGDLRLVRGHGREYAAVALR